MKLFFCIYVMIISTILLSGCGASTEKGGQGDAIQSTDMPGTQISYSMDEIRRNIPLNNLQESGSGKVVAENVRLDKENIGGITETELVAKLSDLAAKTDQAAVNAGFDAKTWAITKEKAGKRLDVEKITQVVLNAGQGARIHCSYLPVQPEITSIQLKGHIRLIADFATPFLDRSRSRIKNIRLTSAKLDKRIIQPGQEFSFNKTTGSKSIRNGYKKATIIVRTPKGPVHKKAPGGGVCQISTTLYNAVLKCGLKVTERHEHSDDVYYVPDGKDATVTYGGADFKFVNTRDVPIMVRVFVGRNSLRVRIYENTGIQLTTG